MDALPNIVGLYFWSVGKTGGEYPRGQSSPRAASNDDHSIPPPLTRVHQEQNNINKRGKI